MFQTDYATFSITTMLVHANHASIHSPHFKILKTVMFKIIGCYIPTGNLNRKMGYIKYYFKNDAINQSMTATSL
jgi:hypothetical protein